MELLRKVLCKDRLPESGTTQYTNLGEREFTYKGWELLWNDKECGDKVEYWYEPITVELESEKILPIEERFLGELTNVTDDEICNWLDKYHKALEAAELGNVLLNSELSLYRERDEIMVNKLIKATQDADERYNEALNFAVNELGLINSDASEDNGIKVLLKLAAYGK